MRRQRCCRRAPGHGRHRSDPRRGAGQAVTAGGFDVVGDVAEVALGLPRRVHVAHVGGGDPHRPHELSAGDVVAYPVPASEGEPWFAGGPVEPRRQLGGRGADPVDGPALIAADRHEAAVLAHVNALPLCVSAGDLAVHKIADHGGPIVGLVAGRDPVHRGHERPRRHEERRSRGKRRVQPLAVAETPGRHACQRRHRDGRRHPGALVSAHVVRGAGEAQRGPADGDHRHRPPQPASERPREEGQNEERARHQDQAERTVDRVTGDPTVPGPEVGGVEGNDRVLAAANHFDLVGARPPARRRPRRRRWRSCSASFSGR